MDNQGELTPPEALKANMDWFINELGGPITINHSHRVVGHCAGWGMGTHPKTNKPAMWVEGVISRGPGGKPFPPADDVWNKIKSGKAKGSSWAGAILREVVETDMDTFKEKVTNDEVLPYSWGLVVDYGAERPTPALNESGMIDYNDKAKSDDEMYIEILEEQHMPDEKEKATEEVVEEKSVEDKVKTEETPKSPEYVTIDQLNSWGEKFKANLVATLSPVEKEKQDEKPADEEEKPKEEDDAEDEKCYGKKKAELEALIKTAEEKQKSLEQMIEKVGTPAPPQKESEKKKAEDKTKTYQDFDKVQGQKKWNMISEMLED